MKKQNKTLQPALLPSSQQRDRMLPPSGHMKQTAKRWLVRLLVFECRRCEEEWEEVEEDVFHVWAGPTSDTSHTHLPSHQVVPAEKQPCGPGSQTSDDGDKWTTGEQLIGIYYFFSKKEGLFPISRAAVQETAGKNVRTLKKKCCSRWVFCYFN